MSNRLTVAIAADFLSCFARIPRKEQDKVAEFINKFRSNPTSSGINYEKIRGAKDSDFRSVRISDSYRGIIKKPEQGNMYLLLWVDTHDEAYTWAERKKCKINPETGSIQVYDVWDSPKETEQAAEEVNQPGLFDSISDRHLLKLGVPKELLPLVKSLRTDEELEEYAGSLPQEAFEALFFLSCGYSLEEVLQSQETEETKQVDENDFFAALTDLNSQRRFVVVEDDEELHAMLNAPLEKWRVFLHPGQRKLVEQNWNGPVRVLGGAGTGKTVAAIHRARYLAEKVYTGNKDRILFTTFTRNLAADIKDQLRRICSTGTMARIEVVNLDRWVAGFLKQNGIAATLLVNGEEARSYWRKALTMAPVELGFSDEFYKEEWVGVIQPQEISTREEYFKASRLGRGTRVDRKVRAAVWPVFEEYRLLLQLAGRREPVDAMRDARILIESGYQIPEYKAVIVDEAQDMSVQAMRLIRAVAGAERENDLFIVGDAHQRIYRHKVVLSKCGINVRGRSRKLRINYRTTDEIRKWSVAILNDVPIDDLDGESDDQKGYKSLLHGHPPVIRVFSTEDDEVGFIINYLRHLGQENWRDTCLVVRTVRILDAYKELIEAAGIPVFQINPHNSDDRAAEGIRFATMHRVKGLEFDNMIIASVNENVVPLPVSSAVSNDQVVREEHEIRERALLYVAATRAKREVVITCCGQPSPFILVE